MDIVIAMGMGIVTVIVIVGLVTLKKMSKPYRIGLTLLHHSRMALQIPFQIRLMSR
jgi:hypothetical protein